MKNECEHNEYGSKKESKERNRKKVKVEVETKEKKEIQSEKDEEKKVGTNVVGDCGECEDPRKRLLVDLGVTPKWVMLVPEQCASGERRVMKYPECGCTCAKVLRGPLRAEGTERNRTRF